MSTVLNGGVDWTRVAEPQLDGYDARVTLEHLERSATYWPRMKYPAEDAPRIWPGTRPAFITLGGCCKPTKEMNDFPHTEPRVQQGIKLLDTWPAVRVQCEHLLIALCPLTMGGYEFGHGCSCGNFGDDWGWIYVTADNAWGLAEGIVHEVGHWKLRAFGVWFENWTDFLLLNDPKDLYVSPVRKDMPRPMGAVLHAQYSYIHVAEMCVRMLQATEAPNAGDFDWTELQLQRITEGQQTLREHARGTPGVGDLFLEGVDAWTTRVLRDGAKAMERRGK